MEEEEPSEKTSRKERWKGALHRTKTKLKEASKKSGKDDFKLSDDVNDFLQGGRPSTSDSGPVRAETPPDKLLYPQIDHDRMVQAGMTGAQHNEHRNITPPRPINPPQRSPRGIPIPRIDVSSSQRWPAQQEIRDLRGQDMNDALRPAQRPEQHTRSQSHGPMPGRIKGNRPRNLSVAFLEAPPVIIGEGGDEAEAPTIEIGRTKARARSVSPMPGRGQAMDGNGSHQQQHQITRKQLPNSAGSAGSGSSISPGHFSPQRLARVQTGMVPASAASKSSADIEFEMSLQAPTPTAARGPSPQRNPEHGDPSVHAHTVTHPDRPPPPPPAHAPPELEAAKFAQTHYGERHLRPATAQADLRMQFEEGEALRHSHYRGLSNSSIVEDSSTSGTEVSPVSPDLRQLRLDDKEKEVGLVSEKRVGEVSPVSPEEGGGWI
jgi:hypothetical protein